jgi:hypothetical protein
MQVVLFATVFDVLHPGPAAADEGCLALSTRRHAHGFRPLLVPCCHIDGGSNPFRRSHLWGSGYLFLSLTGFGLLALLVGRESVLVFSDGFVDVLILIVLLLVLEKYLPRFDLERQLRCWDFPLTPQ